MDDSKIIQQAKDMTNDVLQIFDYQNGASHLEFFITQNNELVFLEVAARTPGASVTKIYDKMFDFNLLNAELQIQLNMPIHSPVHNGLYSIRGIFPIKTGKIINIHSPKLQGTIDLFKLNIKAGDVLENCKSLRDIAATITVSSTEYDKIYQDFKYLSDFDK